MEFKKELIHELIKKQEWKQVRSEIEHLEPHQAAEIISSLELQEDLIVFRLLPQSLARDTFNHLSIEKQENILEAFAKNKDKLSAFLNDLYPDDRTALLEEMPGPLAQRLIQMLSPEEKEITVMLLGYPKDSIGRLMTPDFVAVKPDFTVAQTLGHIRKFGKDSETLNVIYVVDKNWKLLDDLRVREILLANPAQRIDELMDNHFIALNANDDQETAVHAFLDTDRVALPVTDSKGVLLGILTFDDVMDIAEEESTEDFQKFGSFQEVVMNPLKEGIGSLYKKRILWLFALVFMNIFSGAAIAGFEDTITSLVSLVFFLPLLIDSGGNAGAQSATLMVRALATGDVVLKDWLALFVKEIFVAILLGVTMALGVSMVASFRAPEIIIIVALSMVCIVVTGSLVGLSLPFLFKMIKRDPAVASAPLITSIADISGVIIYFSIATWYLGL